jgi:hypothetical protein
MIMTGENQRTCRKPAILPTTNPTQTDPGMNPSLYGERPVTNCLSHGTATVDLIFSHSVLGIKLLVILFAVAFKCISFYPIGFLLMWLRKTELKTFGLIVWIVFTPYFHNTTVSFCHLWGKLW